MERIEELCCYLLSLIRSVSLIHQNSHWLVRGSYGNHLLFQRIYESSAANSDALAEKFVGLFGPDVINLQNQAQFIEKLLSKFSSDDPFKNSLGIEEEYLKSAKHFYDQLEKTGKITLGLDDLLPEISSNRETSVYLLKQSMLENTRKEAMAPEKRARLKLLERLKSQSIK